MNVVSVGTLSEKEERRLLKEKRAKRFYERGGDAPTRPEDDDPSRLE